MMDIFAPYGAHFTGARFETIFLSCTSAQLLAQLLIQQLIQQRVHQAAHRAAPRVVQQLFHRKLQQQLLLLLRQHLIPQPNQPLNQLQTQQPPPPQALPYRPQHLDRVTDFRANISPKKTMHQSSQKHQDWLNNKIHYWGY